jgi:hypothetical protein
MICMLGGDASAAPIAPSNLRRAAAPACDRHS